ncbi:MAG TPA: HigA family addiction module antitoxin [Alphaproteobacteria bacterium]|jgi:addiction module HigA family antidote
MRPRPIHPGEILKEDLSDIGVSAAELARDLRVPANRITRIIKGQQSITANTALRLAHWFGSSAQYWLNLQRNYDLAVAEREIGRLVKGLPRRTAA